MRKFYTVISNSDEFILIYFILASEIEKVMNRETFISVSKWMNHTYINDNCPEDIVDVLTYDCDFMRISITKIDWISSECKENPELVWNEEYNEMADMSSKGISSNDPLDMKYVYLFWDDVHYFILDSFFNRLLLQGFEFEHFKILEGKSDIVIDFMVTTLSECKKIQLVDYDYVRETKIPRKFNMRFCDVVFDYYL